MHDVKIFMKFRVLILDENLRRKYYFDLYWMNRIPFTSTPISYKIAQQKLVNFFQATTCEKIINVNNHKKQSTMYLFQSLPELLLVPWYLYLLLV